VFQAAYNGMVLKSLSEQCLRKQPERAIR